MNETWIDASNKVAAQVRDWKGYLEKFQYLDLIGLYETGWIVYPHTSDGRDFGYPIKKT